MPILYHLGSRLPNCYDAEAEGAARHQKFLVLTYLDYTTLTSCHFIKRAIICCKPYGVFPSRMIHMILLLSWLIREVSISGALKNQGGVAWSQPHIRWPAYVFILPIPFFTLSAYWYDSGMWEKLPRFFPWLELALACSSYRGVYNLFRNPPRVNFGFFR